MSHYSETPKQDISVQADASENATEELSEEQLEEVAGGGFSAALGTISHLGKYGKTVETLDVMTPKGLQRLGRVVKRDRP